MTANVWVHSMKVVVDACTTGAKGVTGAGELGLEVRLHFFIAPLN